MPGVDTESFFRLYDEDYCDKLRYEPCSIDTLEVFESEVHKSQALLMLVLSKS